MNRIRNYSLSFLFFLFFSSVQSLLAYEFLYPVAYTQQNDLIKVYVLYQKSITHLELWVWDPQTKVATKGLLSSYTPAGLRILPSDKGFSFIDEGRIRIKEFHKRSPRVIDIYESLYDINEIEWCNNDTFYFSAKKNDTFCVFQMSIDGLLECLVGDSQYDCMYPQVIRDQLFYIERQIKDELFKREHISYKIFKTTYTKPKLFEQKSKSLPEQLRKAFLEFDDGDIHCDNASTLEKECLADFKKSPISFLRMISDKEGFFLAHPSEVERQDKLLTFDCYFIKKSEKTWNHENIFSFSIPTELLLDVLDARLYESILPLLPKYYNGSIYYVDYYPVKNGNLNIFRYDIALDIIEQKSFGQHGQLSFSPLFIDNKIFYGGCTHESGQHCPSMWINEEGFVCIELPSMQVNLATS